MADLVSIIMNCYNSERYMREAIECVLQQTYQNWELIIWNNNSSDNTKVIANSFTDMRIKVFHSNNFVNLGAARNAAISKASGKFIAFLDSDDIWYCEKLEKILPIFDNKNIGICISNTKFFNEKINRILYTRNKPPVGRVFRELLRNNFISLETVVVRRAAIKKIAFNDSYEMIEEYDFFLRILKNWDLAFVDYVLSGWRVHSDSITQKRPYLLAKELEDMIMHLGREFNNFNSEFPSELSSIRSKILLLKVIYRKPKFSLSELIKLLKESNATYRSILLSFFLNFVPYSIRLCVIKFKRSI